MVLVRNTLGALAGFLVTAALVYYPAFGAACALLLCFTPLSAEPFIYFQF